MPNFIITYQCNNNCAYCFVDFKNQRKIFTVEELTNLLPFIQSFNRDSVNVVGGEPTLNHDFLKILAFFLRNKLEVKVFTNGKVNCKLVEKLQNVNEGDFSFCVNRSNPQLTHEITQFYRKLGYRINLSITIFRSKQKIEHIFDEVITHNLDPNYRLGIALPIWPNKQNVFLHPRDYKLIANEVFTFIQKGVLLGIRPTFDCGFPFCFFNEEQRQYFEKNEIKFSSNCGVIPDICPDFSVIPCFPLGRFKKKISKHTIWQDLQKDINDILVSYHFEPLFKDCKSCEELQTGNCSGGCAAFRIKEKLK